MGASLDNLGGLFGRAVDVFTTKMFKNSFRKGSQLKLSRRVSMGGTGGAICGLYLSYNMYLRVIMRNVEDGRYFLFISYFTRK